MMIRWRGALLLSIFVVACGLSIKIETVHSDDGEVAGNAGGSPPPHGVPLQRSMKERFVSDAIHRSLQKTVRVEFTDVPFEEAVSKLAIEHGLPFLIDRAALGAKEIDAQGEITLHLSDVSLRSALKLMCEPLQLLVVARDDALVITTREANETILETRVYEVGRLLYRKNVDDLIEVLTSCIQSDSWDQLGGPGSIQSMKDPPVLVIRQTPITHNEIGALLEDLQGNVGTVVEKGERATANREKTTREKLTESVEIDADKVALDRALAKIASGQKIQLWIDHRALEDAGISVDQPVSVRVAEVRLESALNLLLSPLQLGWIVEDDVLKITTRTRASQLLATHTYDVRDLARPFERTWPPKREPFGAGTQQGGAFGAGGGMGGMGGGMGGGMFLVDEAERPPLVLGGGFGGALPGQGWNWKRQVAREFDLDDLIEVIQSTIQSDSWNNVGGAGSIREFRNTLVVHQTELVHSEIGSLLRSLRVIKRRNAELKPAAEDTPESMKRVVYDLAGFDYPPAQLAQLIPELIAPSSWRDTNQGGTATLYEQPSSLVITQTRANHAEIVKLLYQVVLKIED